MKRREILMGGAALACLRPGAARAQAWPNRPVRLIVPFPPGGAADVVTRLVAGQMASVLGTPWVVDNRPGGSTMIGAEAAARAAPDGYSFLLASTSTMAAVPALYGSRTPYHPQRDFAPVGLVARAPFFIFVQASAPIASLAELVSRAKAEPGRLSYGSNGTGQSAHLGMELLQRAAGFEMLHVPYRSMVPAMTDLLGGRLTAVLGDMTSAAGAVRAGQLRVLAAAGPERSPIAPDIPTVNEALGITAFDASPWFGVFAPAGTAEEVISRLAEALAAYLVSDAARSAFLNVGLVPIVATPAELTRLVASDFERLSRLIVEQRITPE